MTTDRRAGIRLPFALQVRLTADQRTLLERTAYDLDLTLSGAVRHLLDVALDTPTDDEDPRAPTLRQIFHERQERDDELERLDRIREHGDDGP